MRRALVVMFLASLAGCGEYLGGGEHSVAGTWQVTTADVVSLDLTRDGHYTIAVARADAPGNVQRQSGYYFATDGAMAFNPTASSCPNDTAEWYRSYYVADKTLVLLDEPHSTFVFEPGCMPEGGTAGCFAADGSFAPLK